MLTYIFTPFVHAPWGEMQLTLVTRATNYFDARRQVVAELCTWKQSQIDLKRNDFPWLDEAINIMQETEHVSILGMHADKDTKVLVNWYDERETFHKT